MLGSHGASGTKNHLRMDFIAASNYMYFMYGFEFAFMRPGAFAHKIPSMPDVRSCVFNFFARFVSYVLHIAY